MYIAAVLEKAGHAVQIYDSDPEYQSSMIRDIKDFNPDLIGLSFLTVGYQRAFNLMKNLKKEMPDKIYCSGGVHTTVKPKETLEEFGLDFIVIGGKIQFEHAVNWEQRSLAGSKALYTVITEYYR
jgi:magnesium-protoporphyrin IX monomethyl ester (oxidative) cyclase